jgi:hypothetical protein
MGNESLELKVNDLEQRLQKNESYLKIVISTLDTIMGKQCDPIKEIEHIKPMFNLSKELNSRGLKHTPEELSRLQVIIKPYTDEQIGFTLTKISKQAAKTTIKNLVGYIKRSLEIEYPSVRPSYWTDRHE